MRGCGALWRLRPPTFSRLSRVRTRERTTALALSLEDAQHARLPRALAARACRAALVVVDPLTTLRETTAIARSLSPSVQGSAATCQLRLPRTAGFHVCAHASARLLSLSLERRRSTRALLAHAGWPTLVGVAPRPTKGQCAGERSPSFGARPCCDVTAAASSLRSRL